MYTQGLLLHEGVQPNVVNAGTCRTCLDGGGLIHVGGAFDRERCDAHQLVACSMPNAYTFFEQHVPSKPAKMAPVCTTDRHRDAVRQGMGSRFLLSG